MALDITYKTERLVLKVLDKSFADVVLDYNLRNRDFLKEWISLEKDNFYTIKVHKKILSYEVKLIRKLEYLKLWIFKKSDNRFDRTIGTICFSNIIRGNFKSCFLGYKLDKDEINKGYMTEAIEKGIDIMFNEYKLHRIEANIMPKNKRSLKVLEKLGFENEGLAKRYLEINGKWENHTHMVMLSDELEEVEV